MAIHSDLPRDTPVPEPGLAQGAGVFDADDPLVLYRDHDIVAGAAAPEAGDMRERRAHVWQEDSSSTGQEMLMYEVKEGFAGGSVGRDSGPGLEEEDLAAVQLYGIATPALVGALRLGVSDWKT